MYQTQLQWIRALQETLSAPWIQGFFNTWRYFDTPYFAFLVIALCWYLWDRRIGIGLFYVLTISLVVNALLKNLFLVPRPCQVDQLVGVICSKYPGFPSGNAQTAAILCGLVFIESKRTLYRWLILIFAFFLCFSRVYLGVHYPTDILGGLVVGALLMVMYAKVFPLFEKKWRVAAIVFPFVLLFLCLLMSMPLTFISNVFFVSLGVAVGLITYERRGVQKAKNLRQRSWQTLSVLVGLSAFFIAEYFLPNLIILWNFGKGYWLSFLGVWLISPKK